MKQLAIIVILILAIYWVSKKEESIETAEPEAAPASSQLVVKPKSSQNNGAIQPAKVITEEHRPSIDPQVVPSNSEISERPKELQAREKSIQQIMQERLKNPIGEDLSAATFMTNWGSEQVKHFTGPFEGQVKIKGKEYLVRMSLMFDGANYDITPNSCVGLFDQKKTVFSEAYSAGKIKFYRTDVEKYIIISVQDMYYFRIFNTSRGGYLLSVELNIGGQNPVPPVMFELKELNASVELNGCHLENPTDPALQSQ